MAITWTEGAPGSRSDVSAGAQAVRDLKIAFADGVEPSMYWPGSGGGSAASAGEMKLGTFRTFVASASALSSPTDNGRLFLDSGATRLYGPTSNSTQHWYGSPRHIAQTGSVATSARWVLEAGSFTYNYKGAGSRNSADTVVFAVTYGAPPVILVAQADSVVYAQFAQQIIPTASTTTGFFPECASPSGTSMQPGQLSICQWMSLGTLAF